MKTSRKLSVSVGMAVTVLSYFVMAAMLHAAYPDKPGTILGTLIWGAVAFLFGYTVYLSLEEKRKAKK
jgi:lipopolysaccharide export LptBFGC system permease protein LptF